jgi:hypothetical protein
MKAEGFLLDRWDILGDYEAVARVFVLPFSLHGPKLFGNLVFEVCGLRFLLSLQISFIKKFK